MAGGGVVCALGALSLTGCDSKIGTAAVVSGSKIPSPTSPGTSIG